MTEQELKEIEARANAATPGPWDKVVWTCNDGGYASAGPTHNSSGLEDGDSEDDETNAELDARFIAHAREDVPALIAEVRRLREVLWGPELRLYCARCQELVTPVSTPQGWPK